jgi:hypothetical protein
MKNKDPDTTQKFVTKAQQCRVGASKLHERQTKMAEGPFDQAIAVAAIHSAISLSDAICVAAEGDAPTHTSHAARVAYLKQLCKRHSVQNMTGIEAFEAVIEQKQAVEYTDKKFDIKAAAALMNRADKFWTWTRREFPEVMRDEERS